MKYQAPYGVSNPDAPYVNGDPTIGRQGSIPPAASIEYPQREIVNFIDHSNQIPTDDDLRQLTRGIRNGWVNFGVDIGVANSLVVTLDPPLLTYRQGMPLRVLVAHNNTGASVINIDALGVRPIKRANGADLAADDMRAGQVAVLVDDGTNFQLTNFLGALAGTVNNTFIDIPYAEDTALPAAPNALITVFAPAITAPQAGDLILVKVKNANTGQVTLKVNALAPVPVGRNDAQALQARDLIANETILLEQQTGGWWQMMRLVRSQVYIRLTADLLLYVRTDGNDTTGDGSINDAAHAFRTIQGAINYVAGSFLIAGRAVTIQLGIPGTYTGQVYVAEQFSGQLVIKGDQANPMSYIIQGMTNATAEAQFGDGAYNTTAMIRGSGVSVHFWGVAFAPQDPGFPIIEVQYNASLVLDACSFSGINTNGPAVAVLSATCSCYNEIHFYNSCDCAFRLGFGGVVTIGLWYTLINTHGVTFSSAFIVTDTLCSAFIAKGWCGFAGGAIGKRYWAQLNSVINTGSGDVNYLPGNQPGVVYDNSIYA